MSQGEIRILGQDRRTFEIDGHKFDVPTSPIQRGHDGMLLYLLARARHGDPDAKAICDGMRLGVRDADGKLFYPMPENEAATQPNAKNSGK